MTGQRYLLHGVSIVSDLVLSDLQADPGAAVPQVRVTIGAVPMPPAQAVAHRGGRMYWDGRRLLLWIPGTARFAITDQEICVEPAAGADHEAVQMLLLGSVWAACCHLRDCLLLHASAVLIGTTCVAFLGDSGAGKSTLAALLATRGHRIAADDTCLLVGTPAATRLYPGPVQLKLWREHLPLLADAAAQIRPAAQQPGKFKLALPGHWLTQAQTVRRLLLLDSNAGGSPLGFIALSPLDALRVLAAHTFRLKILTLLGRQQQHFAQCAAVLANTEVYRWIRPWGMQHSAQMLDMLEDWLAGCPPHGTARRSAAPGADSTVS